MKILLTIATLSGLFAVSASQSLASHSLSVLTTTVLAQSVKSNAKKARRTKPTETLVVGASCELSQDLTVLRDLKKKSTKVKLATGTRVKIVELAKAAVKIETDGTTLATTRASLKKVCVVVEGTGVVRLAAGEAAAPVVNASQVEPGASPSVPLESLPSSPNDVPAEIKVAVMDLRGSEGLGRDLVMSLTTLVPQVLDELGPFKAISSQDIAQMLAFEQLKDSLGCDDVTCLAEIGGALGVDFIVSGSILLTGKKHLLQLQLMNIRESKVVDRVTREHDGPAEGLVEEVRTATKLLVRDVLAKRLGNLRVVVSEEGATIRLDGSIVGASPMPPLAVSSGMHTLVVEKEGFVRFTRDIEVRAHVDNEVTASLLASVEHQKRQQERAALTRRLAWTSLAVGVVGFGGGAGLYVYNRGQASTLNDDINAYAETDIRATSAASSLTKRRETVAKLDVLTVVAGAVGVVGLATGIVLLVTGDRPTYYEPTLSVGQPAGGKASITLTPSGVALHMEL